MPPQEQTFSNVQPVPQSFSDVTPIGTDSAGGTAANPHAAILEKYGLPEATDLAKGFFGQDSKLNLDPLKFSQAYSEANPPPPEAKGYFSNMWGEAKDIAHGLFSEGTGTASTPPIPGKGAYETAKSRLAQAKTDLPGALGRTTTDVAATVLPFVADAAIESSANGIRAGWRKIGNPLGLASTGQELLAQGIGARNSLLKFKPSLEKAAGDLKAYDAQSPINSVQDLSDAIPEIKQKIWNEEIEPALKRQATKTVDMQPVADKVRAQISDEMKTFDEGNAEKLEKLASKLETTKNVTGANSLLKYINGQLESYFQKFPAARRANLMNNPETAGWEAARSELRSQFLGTLENAGETGVRDARLRYGAFDTLQDAVERRVIQADRAKPMSLGRIVGLAAAPVTGGLSVVAGELSHYLNKPDVLVRRGIRSLPGRSALPEAVSLEPQATSPVTGGAVARPDDLFRSVNQ